MDKAKTIVLIHGHGVDSSIWNDLYTVLTADYQVVKPDFSSQTNHGSIEAYAEELYSMLLSGQIDKATLIGHSMGGYIALAFAERYPDMVNGLVLFHSTVFADDEERKAKRKVAIQQLEEQGSSAFIEESVPKMVSDATKTKHADLVQQRVQIGNQLPAEALAMGVRAIASRPDRSQVLRDAPFPVLIIAGKEDKLIPFEKSEPMANLLNDKGRFIAMEGVGHLGMLENPEEATRLIREFLVKV